DIDLKESDGKVHCIENDEYYNYNRKIANTLGGYTYIAKRIINEEESEIQRDKLQEELNLENDKKNIVIDKYNDIFKMNFPNRIKHCIKVLTTKQK
ncbi:unnamed protein product, partial [marine sediment metagenome]